MKTADAIRHEAARWLAEREDRALTRAEQREYESWLAADPRHPAAMEEMERAWTTFDGLRFYLRAQEGVDDPDFFARRRRTRWVRPMILAAAAAAALAIGLSTWRRSHPAPVRALAASPQAELPRFVRLPDGSEVELNAGSEIVPLYTQAERRIRLLRGEAQFTVEKSPDRPFVVEASGVAVKALGTVFNVRRDDGAVEVLVTEGRVWVNSPHPANALMPAPGALLVAGQRTIVPTGAAAPAAAPPGVVNVGRPEIDRMLAWQSSRLVFDGTPLSEVVARFNRHVAGIERIRLIVTDRDLGALRISGRFRADDQEGFVELLENGFGVEADRTGGDILLRPIKNR